MFEAKPSQTKYWCGLIFLAVVVNASGLWSPVLNSNDAYFYAIISKNMLISHNWVDLIYAGSDWLDKPHLPFWLTAFSFKVFGVTPFAYVLPGFLFHLLGAIYTYRLAKLLYNQETGLIAALIYVSSLHLLLSAMDIRAEAYLLGEIMPACYYWLIYDRATKPLALVLGGFFSGLAMMTKGPFVVITIFSGLVCSWLYCRQYWRIISPKWLLAYLLSLFFLLPELICLYLQFDAHPEKDIFGHNHVSGLAWYFWGSQFGRFFNSGPIVNTHGNPFFFIHTFLWAFLPWSLLFIVAAYNALRDFKLANATDKINRVYLLAGFGLTFIMFSATKFQLDHYTNIIMPFAAILCAAYVLQPERNLALLARLQSGLSLLLLLITICLCSYLFGLSVNGMVAIAPILLVVYIWKTPNPNVLVQIVTRPVLAICCTFGLLMLINGQIYPRYAIAYQATKVTNQLNPLLPLFSYKVPGVINALTFHSQAESVQELPELKPPVAVAHYYLLLNQSDQTRFPESGLRVAGYQGLAQEKFIPSLLSHTNYLKNIQPVVLLEVNTAVTH